MKNPDTFSVRFEAFAFGAPGRSRLESNSEDVAIRTGKASEDSVLK
jgi:hypothetical protein